MKIYVTNALKIVIFNFCKVWSLDLESLQNIWNTR